MRPASFISFDHSPTCPHCGADYRRFDFFNVRHWYQCESSSDGRYKHASVEQSESCKRRTAPAPQTDRGEG